MYLCVCVRVHAFVREGRCREVLMERRTTSGYQDPATKGLKPFVFLDPGTLPNVMYFF